MRVGHSLNPALPCMFILDDHLPEGLISVASLNEHPYCIVHLANLRREIMVVPRGTEREVVYTVELPTSQDMIATTEVCDMHPKI